MGSPLMLAWEERPSFTTLTSPAPPYIEGKSPLFLNEPGMGVGYSVLKLLLGLLKCGCPAASSAFLYFCTFLVSSFLDLDCLILSSCSRSSSLVGGVAASQFGSTSLQKWCLSLPNVPRA